MGNEARTAARDFRSVFMRLIAIFLIAQKIISFLSLVNIIVSPVSGELASHSAFRNCCIGVL